MTLKRLVLSSIFAIPMAAAIGLACSAPDPGEVTFSTNPAKLKADGGAGGGGGGGGGGGDSGGPGGPPSAFDGFPAYQSGSGASTDRTEHQNRFGSQNPAGQDCLSCHGDGGGGVTQFSMAGTIFPPDAGDGGAPNVEVRVANLGDGGSIATYTNSEGNFYYLASVGVPIEANALVGARNATATENMATHLTGPTGGSCNQKGTCHGGTQGKIHVP